MPILSRSHYPCLTGEAHKVDVGEELRIIPDLEVRVKIEKVRFTGGVSYHIVLLFVMLIHPHFKCVHR